LCAVADGPGDAFGDGAIAAFAVVVEDFADEEGDLGCDGVAWELGEGEGAAGPAMMPQQ
jgi:hypothetical protein